MSVDKEVAAIHALRDAHPSCSAADLANRIATASFGTEAERRLCGLAVGERRTLIGVRSEIVRHDAQKRGPLTAGDRKVKTKYFVRPPTKNQVQGAAEDRRLLTARRNFHADMLARFPEYLAKADEKVRAAVAERAKLTEKHIQAPNGVVECDRLLASLERTYPHLTLAPR
jgi:hypothetical protein